VLTLVVIPALYYAAYHRRHAAGLQGFIR